MEKGERAINFTTLDAYLAGYLCLHGQEPRLIDQGGKIAFNFTATPAIQRLLREFSLGSTVVASEFVFQIKSLKSRVHELRKRSGRSGPEVKR